MFSSGTIRRLAFTSRQLSRLLETDDPDSALKKLREAGGSAYAQDVDRLQALLVPQAERPSGPGPYAALANLMPEVGAATSRFFQDFVDYVRRSNVVFSTWWTGLAGLVWYLVVLCGMAVVISGTFALFVLPWYAATSRYQGPWTSPRGTRTNIQASHLMRSLRRGARATTSFS